MHNGNVVPEVIVLSHPEQRERLKDTCPEAVPNTLLAGDICYDRLRASTPLRPSYRRSYGLETGQRLIVVSTTWGPDSLLGIDPDFPRKLASALPVDRFRIILCLHPNIRSHHSRWQVAEYLSGAARAGIEISEGVGDWRTAVVAADLILGDHGSIPYYSTALGNPLLLAAAPTHSVDPASPSAQLLRAAPKLDLGGDFVRQIEQAITEHDADRYSGIAALTSSTPDAGAELLRAALYRTMRLPEPDEPAEISALPLPARPLAGASSHVVHVRRGTERAATITRFPAERLHTDLPNGADTHLAVGVVEPRRGWLQSADILVGEPGTNTDRWITDSLARLPGCALATAPVSSGDWLLGDKNRMMRVTGPAPAPRLFASLAYHLLCRGERLDELTGPWTIHCAERTFTITVAAL